MKTHISLNVANVEKSIEFYSKMFGVKPFKVRTNYAKFDISDPPLNLTMNQAKVEKGGSLSHLGLQVATTQEVENFGARWRENGLLTRDEMQTDCCYALQDKIWVSDPDGNGWEVFVVLGDSTEWSDDNAEAVSAAPCCVPDLSQISINRETKSSCC